jgi:hypothetical protein
MERGFVLLDPWWDNVVVDVDKREARLLFPLEDRGQINPSQLLMGGMWGDGWG